MIPGRGLKRERGILSCCKGSPASPSASLSQVGTLTSTSTWRAWDLSLRFFWPAGAHLSWTRLSTLRCFLALISPDPLGSLLWRRRRRCPLSPSVLPFRAFCHEICKAQLKNFLFVLIKQSFSILSFSFWHFQGKGREGTDCIIKSQQRLFRHFHDNYRFGNGFT